MIIFTFVLTLYKSKTNKEQISTNLVIINKILIQSGNQLISQSFIPSFSHPVSQLVKESHPSVDKRQEKNKYQSIKIWFVIFQFFNSLFTTF